MPDIIFTHPNINRSLVVETGANDISWSYDLNTQAYPTYGGEVVQVLSVSINEITIQGEVKSYAKMEEIYRWFLEYMQSATQGYRGASGYNESAVTMTYDHRGWSMSIQPIQLPNMRYGREVIIPEWQLVAHVVVPDPETQQLSIDNGIGSLVGGDLDFFKKSISADIGFRSQNPFSDPNGLITPEENALYGKDGLPTGVHVEGEKLADSVAALDAKNALTNIGKQMSAMFAKLVNGQVDDIFHALQETIGGEASQPASTQSTDPNAPGAASPDTGGEGSQTGG